MTSSSSDTAVALITVGGAIGGALVGVAAGLFSTVAANRYARKEASASRRRSAYAEFLLAAGRLVWLLVTAESVGAAGEKLQADVLAAVDETARLFVVVRLTGPDKASQAAAKVVDHAHQVLALFKPGQPLPAGLKDLADEYEADLNAFTAIARAEYAGATRSGRRAQRSGDTLA